MVLEIIVAVFGFVLTILGTILIMSFKDMKTDVKVMSGSMINLNLKLEKVITDQSWHKEETNEIKVIALSNRREISKNKERLHTLEGGQSQVIEFLKTNKTGEKNGNSRNQI